MQIPRNGLDDLLHDDRLGQMTVHARIQGRLHILGEGVGGHGDDGDGAPVGAAPGSRHSRSASAS